MLINNMENFQSQLINIISHKTDTYVLIYSVLYLCIIIMIGIFLYWDTIYKTAKRCSKCNNISKIIDENMYTETPYVYSIIIVNTKKIKKLSEYIIKITYDFNKMETKIEYGNTEGEDRTHIYHPFYKTNMGYDNSEGDESVFVYRMNDYKTILEDLKALEKKKIELMAVVKKSNKRSDLAEYNKVMLEYTRIIKSKEGKKAIELNNNDGFLNSFNYNYFNLEKMKPGIIEDISTRINSNNYKYYAVDKNYNIVYSYTTGELIKLTKNYSKNSKYPVTIIDYIIFSRIQQSKNINI
jgi:hypothetical protein